MTKEILNKLKEIKSEQLIDEDYSSLSDLQKQKTKLY